MSVDSKQNSKPLFVRVSEAAKLLSMSRSKAYEAMQQGVIPAVRIAGVWRVPREALEQMAADAMNPPASRSTHDERG
jgi:excisionase family DNA binding protein